MVKIIRWYMALFVLCFALSVHAQDFESVKRAAEQGNAEAQFNLGKMYVDGQGVAKNEAEGAKWIKRAAEQGYSEAQLILAWMYGKGRLGVVQNRAEALKWTRRAAEQGNAMAQYGLGELYENGFEELGVVQDDAEALKWYRRAASQGNPEAKRKVKETEHRISVTQKFEALERQTPPAPQYRAGHERADAAEDIRRREFQRREELVRESARAREKYALARNQTSSTTRHGEAQGTRQEDSRLKGQGAAQNDAATERRMAEQGDAEAQFKLGTRYKYGQGVTQNDAEALKWFRKAAEQGNTDAQFTLGMAYERGQGVMKNDAEAVKWYQKAAERGDTRARKALEARKNSSARR